MPARIASGSGVDHYDPRAARVYRPRQAEVLLAGDDDLVFRPDAEAGEHDVAAVRRRARERDVLGIDPHELGESCAHVGPDLQQAVEVRLPDAAVLEVCPQLLCHRVGCRAGKRPERARVQVRDVLEHGEERTGLRRRHPTVTSTGA